MDFAVKLMGKYGWKKGDGLGKLGDGITKPIKANYKFDNAGFGHNKSDEYFNPWWNNAFSAAVANLQVETNESNEVVFGLKNGQSIEISTKTHSNQNIDTEEHLKYGGEVLKNVALMNVERNISDDHLFKACGGRTAHKGARHGLDLRGKLSRIEEQEKNFMEVIKARNDDYAKVYRLLSTNTCKLPRRMEIKNEMKIKRLKTTKNEMKLPKQGQLSHSIKDISKKKNDRALKELRKMTKKKKKESSGNLEGHFESMLIKH